MPRTRPVFRILSHQACTGGTIISRYLAAFPSIALVSEISPAGKVLSPRFDPLSPLTQMRSYYPDLITDQQVSDMLVDQLVRLEKACREQDHVFIIRDHAHSEYMLADTPSPFGLSAGLRKKGKVKTALTVRHPAESFLSVRKSFPDEEVGNIETYCQRYLHYLDDLGATDPYHYEDFCENPAKIAKEIFAALDVDTPGSKEGLKWQAISRSGNSGRFKQSTQIRSPAPHDVDPVAINHVLRDVEPYHTLCARLGYEADYEAHYAATMHRAMLWDLDTKRPPKT